MYRFACFVSDFVAYLLVVIEMKWIELNYDIPKCCEWVRHGEAAQQKVIVNIIESPFVRFLIVCYAC